MTALRLCFIVLFGAMSLMHGPVMTFSGAHAEAAVLHDAASDDAAGHAHHGGGHDQAPPAAHLGCNAFACFLAVEPLPATARPLHAILFGVMAAAPMRALDPIRVEPDLPPPRVQS